MGPIIVVKHRLASKGGHVIKLLVAWWWGGWIQMPSMLVLPAQLIHAGLHFGSLIPFSAFWAVFVYAGGMSVCVRSFVPAVCGLCLQGLMVDRETDGLRPLRTADMPRWLFFLPLPSPPHLNPSPSPWPSSTWFPTTSPKIRERKSLVNLLYDLMHKSGASSLWLVCKSWMM